MEFDWTNFALEVLNFLVLVWLLKRFFYRPVLAVIDARQAATAKTIADAESVRLEADALKTDYQTRLAGVDKDREEAKDALNEEIASERTRRLAALELEVNADLLRRQMLQSREASAREAALERQALSVAARFASRFLDRLAGPDLNSKLVEFALGELDALAPDKLDILRDPGANIKVVSAYPLDAAQRMAFTQSLGRLAGRALAPDFTEDGALKAGVCIVAGAWVLMANLRDELSFFGESFHHGS